MNAMNDVRTLPDVTEANFTTIIEHAISDAMHSGFEKLQTQSLADQIMETTSFGEDDLHDAVYDRLSDIVRQGSAFMATKLVELVKEYHPQ